MRSRISRIILALIAVSIIALGLLAWTPIRRVMNMRALEQAAPAAFVEFSTVGESRHDYTEFEERIIDKIGMRTYRLWFGGAIESIAINGATSLNGDVGGVLVRFPKLVSFSINMGDHATANEVDWTRLCQGLRSCPRLADLTIYDCEMLTDDALAQLADHPALEVLSVKNHGLTPAFVATLATMPALTSLFLSDNGSDKSRAFTEAQWKELCVALRELPDLEGIVLLGSFITDDAITPLAGHPSIHRLQFSSLHLSTRSVSTFASMPSLTLLNFYEGWNEKKTASYEVRRIIPGLLPSVNVRFSP